VDESILIFSRDYDTLVSDPGRPQSVLDIPVLTNEIIKLTLPILDRDSRRSVYSGCTMMAGGDYKLLCFDLIDAGDTPRYLSLDGTKDREEDELGEAYPTLQFHRYLPFETLSDGIFHQPSTTLSLRQKRSKWARKSLDISRTTLPDCLSIWAMPGTLGVTSSRATSVRELGRFAVFEAATELANTLIFVHSHESGQKNQEILRIRPFNHQGMALFDARYYDNGIRDGLRHAVSQIDRAVINLTDRRICIALKPRGNLNHVSYLTITCNTAEHNHELSP
jgi:hypothetical protein